MSTLYALRSICGNKTTYVDAWELNHACELRCCDNCESILECRKAWGFLYQKGNK